MSSQSYLYNPTERTLAATGDGFSPPRLTTAGRTALNLSPGDRGVIVYDTTLSVPYWWTGVAWATFSGGAAYSQGLWLAQLIPAVGSITEDPAVKTGYWSQIGNTISISMKIRVQAVAMGTTGLLKMVTLPFPAVQETALTVTADLLNNGAKTTLMAYATGNDINLYHYENGILMDLAQHVPAGGVFWVSGTYITP
jgi:hypothetical protein